ncbi:hypothetical protein ACFQ7F_11760 [Streptomyces sp. NPDC056486]|uniref:hypothetical protein n=1 Tax=Streptomyces sp. NPDC056486 TaxID=3345835 RepID=UPI0036A3BB7B
MSTHRRRAILRTTAVTAVATSALLMPAVAAVAAADSPVHAEGSKGTKDTKTVAPVAPIAPVTQVAPKGSVEAGIEGFHSGDPVFIAAGGAMAAAGAAGLGYSMLRRGRTDA